MADASAMRIYDVVSVGGAGLDTVIALDRLPTHDEKVLGQFVGYVGGGPASNFACAASRLGLRATALVKVGDDEAGRLIGQGFADVGVDTSNIQVVPGRASNFTICMIDPSGEKAVVVVPMLDEALPLDVVRRVLPQSRLLFGMPNDRQRFGELIAVARASETVVMIDVEATVVPDPPDMAAFLAGVDIVSFNQASFTVATGLEPSLAAARALLAHGPRLVIVTLGARGALAVAPDDAEECPGFAIDVVDTTGASDTFNAAFVRAMFDGESLAGRLRFANAAAALAVTGFGARGHLPDREEVARFLHERGRALQVDFVREDERVIQERNESVDQDFRHIITQVESLPTLIRDELETLDLRVRRLLNHNECLSVKRIVITGSGDSHMAGLAAELAFERLAGIPVEPMTGMQAGRYASAYFDSMFPRNPLTVAISVSGSVARTREAVILARKQGALTVAMTANPDSPLAGAAEYVLDCTVPESVPAPGVRSYRVSLMMLYLLAIHLAEVNGRITQDRANELRQELKGTADTIAATIEAIRQPTRELAKAVAEEKNFVFVGDGPNYATALFSAAKVIEAAGRHAMGQDTEEWAHLQYFVNTDPSTPTFMISPGERGHSRAVELAAMMKQVGRTVVGVVPEGEVEIAKIADWVLPVVGGVSEMFSPMVYPVAGELFSAYLSEAIGEPPFRQFNGDYVPRGITIRNSAVMEDAVV